MSKIYPVLKFYFYSPNSPNHSSPTTAISNNSFYNQVNTCNSVASAISMNLTLTSFDKNIFSHTYNANANLYLNNTNDILSNSIGNLLAKRLSIKTNNFNNIYANNQLVTFYIYDQSNFNFGTITCSFAYNYLSQLNSNGFDLDSIYIMNVIYSDGYYTYLINNPSLKITIEIINGIRNVTIPSDPSNNYDPTNNILNYNLIDLFSFKNTDSNYTLTDNTLNTYFITGQIFDKNLQIQIGQSLISHTNVLNATYSNNHDCLDLQIFSIENTSSVLAKSGNILGLIVESDKIITTHGSFSNTNDTLFGSILYADGDFTYLNATNTLLPYKESINKQTGIRTLSVPDINPYNKLNTFVPENQIINGKMVYFTFYYLNVNNSNVYNNAIDTQDYTLASNFIYDSYDYINNIAGNIIGSIIVYKTTNITLQNNNIITMSFSTFNFNNGLILFTVGVYILPLTKIGDRVNGTSIHKKIISCSPEFNTMFFSSYSITDITGKIVSSVSINCLNN